MVVGKLSVVLVLLSLTLSASGTALPVRFTHIGVDEGLSQGTVNSICQDSHGNIWMGTEYGINRYDGATIHSYTEKDGLPDSHIRKIHSDSEGTLWFCCGNFLVSTDTVGDDFRTISVPADFGEIYDFFFAPGGRIVAGCRFGMHCVDIVSGSLDDDFIPDSLKKTRVNSFKNDGDEVLMATRDFGRHLFRWNLCDGNVVDEPIGPHKSDISDVLSYRDSLWVGTSADGLILRTPNGIRTYTVLDGLCSNTVRTILRDRTGRLWVGTFKGVNIIENGRVTTSFTKEGGYLSHNTVRCIFEDSPEGGIWLGNYYFGVDYYHPFRSIFNDTAATLGETSLQNELVSCMAVAGSDLFLGAAGKGVWKYSPWGCRVFTLPDAPNGKENSNDIKVIYPDPYNGKLYVGAHGGGFSEVDPRTGRSVMLVGMEMLNTYAVEPWGRDSLLIGTLRGLYVFDKSTGDSRLVSDEVRIRTLCADSDGNIWAGGENGLSVYDAHDLHTLDLPEELGQISFVYSIFRSSSHNLFLVTDKTLFRFVPGDDNLIRYDAFNRFSGNSLSAVAEDLEGMIWISTSNGISRFNPETGETRNWFSSDGIPCPQFSRNASITLPDGRILFGAHKGMVSFDPSMIADNPYCADVRIEISDIDGNKIGGEDGIYSIPNGGNACSLYFSAPNFASGQHTRYECVVNGVPNEIEGNSLILSGLKPGRYHIDAAAINSSGVKSAGRYSVEVVVPIPVWNWFAPSLTFVAALVFLFLFLRRKKSATILENEPDEYENLSASEREFLERADAVIRSNLGNPDFTIEVFAKEMCVSKSTLQHKIRETSGESALDRIRRFRFTEACRLLKENKLSISQISEETGFRSPSYFSTSFKDYVGCLPSEYSKRNLHDS